MIDQAPKQQVSVDQLYEKFPELQMADEASALATTVRSNMGELVRKDVDSHMEAQVGSALEELIRANDKKENLESAKKRVKQLLLESHTSQTDEEAQAIVDQVIDSLNSKSQ